MIDKKYTECTRLLTVDDIPKIKEIFELKTSISKIPSDESKSKVEFNIESEINNPNHRLIGYFENGELVSFLSQVIASKMPAWHMPMLGTKSTHRWNYTLNGLEFCWANAMDFAEQHGIYRIYWALPKSWSRTQLRTINTSDVWKRYDIYIESELQPYEFPFWPEQQVSYGNLPKPYEVVVKMGVLKNEHRKFDIKI